MLNATTRQSRGQMLFAGGQNPESRNPDRKEQAIKPQDNERKAKQQSKQEYPTRNQYIVKFTMKGVLLKAQNANLRILLELIYGGLNQEKSLLHMKAKELDADVRPCFNPAQD
ncbi:hypothetical protein M513_00683 [Trichuris suis]|uniref:Uncharacterized protein n=1 Tax=Trichuris suis TaxID=68888 RepID=A0A085MML1_9BILA|nr:hypothetical protein M513_00683 [Trichuris suis]